VIPNAFTKHAAANALVTKVGTRIAQATGRTDLPWEFTVIDEPKTVNAFALPGGKVAVYTGILPITRDEAGLAAVLGHEVSHVMARHSAERVSQQLGVQLTVQLAGAIFGVDPQVTQAGAALLANGLLLPWGRSQESEADHLGLIYMALITRITRASVLEVLGADYVRTAHAKGQRPARILFTHALKNAAVPIVTTIGVSLTLLISGVVITESVFALPGLGRLAADAVLQRDYSIIQGVTLLSSAVYVLVNLAVDLCYVVLDPRIRY